MYRKLHHVLLCMSFGLAMNVFWVGYAIRVSFGLVMCTEVRWEDLAVTDNGEEKKNDRPGTRTQNL